MSGLLAGAPPEAAAALLGAARALVFDFDGTLVDSNPIKWAAFDACFARFPAHREAIAAYCRQHHHTPRGEKFRYVYEQMLKQPYTPAIEAQLHAAFADLTTQAIVEAPEIPGAGAALAAAARRFPVALLSSTPHALLEQIVQQRGWRRHLSALQGAPVRKADWLAAWARQGGWPARHVLFFGDTPEDAAAARAAGCAFVGVRFSGRPEAAAVQLADFQQLAWA